MMGFFSFVFYIMKILVLLQLIGISASGAFLKSLSIHIGYLLVVSSASHAYSSRIYHCAMPAGN